MKRLNLVLFLLASLLTSSYAQSEFTIGLGLTYHNIDFVGENRSTIITEVMEEPFSKSYLTPSLEYRRYFEGTKTSLSLEAMYFNTVIDIFVGGGVAGRAFTEMQFTAIPVQLGVTRELLTNLYLSLNANITVLSSLNATEYDSKPIEEGEIIERNNQLLGVGGALSYRLWEKIDLRFLFSKGLKWRSPSIYGDTVEYQMQPIDLFNLSVRYVWSPNNNGSVVN